MNNMKGDYKFEEKNKTENYPPSVDFKTLVNSSLDELLPNKSADLAWNNYFYIFERPIIIDAAAFLATCGLSTSGGSFGGSRSAIIAKTGTTSGNYSYASIIMSTQNIIRFDKSQRFRTAFSIDNVSDETFYLVRGSFISGSNKYYGFKVVGTAIYGVAKNGGSEQTVLLKTAITAATIFDVEARFSPDDKIVFLIRNATSGFFVEEGSLATGLPVGTTSTEFFEAYITTGANAGKELTFSYVEYIQKR